MVAQHESFTFTATRMNTVYKQHWYFTTRMFCDLLKVCKVRNNQTQQHTFLFLKLSVKTTSLSVKVTTW